ncbi:MAG: 4-phosphopantetheinyl transferase [Bacteroidota bacterium]|nr:4-phosphopantetheinyl transferase [Bacteroidota bacterium]
MLPDVFQSEIRSYKYWESAQASLLGKIILLHGLKELRFADSLDDLRQQAKERPFINDKIDFNISHSGEYVIVAISGHARVGIDIEMHREIDVSLFRKYFDEDEWKEIKTSSNAAKTFFKLWAIKESAIKCDGRGVEVLSKTKVVRPLPAASRQTPQSGQTTSRVICDSKEFYFRILDIEENYSCAVCSNKDLEVILSRLPLKNMELPF